MRCIPCSTGPAINNMAIPSDASHQEPLLKEPCIVIDWNLPLTTRGQTMLFARWIADFAKATKIVQLDRRPKYRLTPEKLLELRTVIAFWDQIMDHCQAHMEQDGVFARNSTRTKRHCQGQGAVTPFVPMAPN